MIISLAGHVDHGKTTLVRLLTGQNTDRLAEEQRRGLTIDLGFAYLENDGTTLGFVDVPGHHRFIHNMVAGVAAHQFALLVIAADDGPMPQTREHLQILQLTGVQHGLVALTKCDRVDAQRIAEVRGEIARLLRGTFLEGAPIVETSAEDPASITRLKTELLAAASRSTAPISERPFRLPVDRAFTVKGAGLVVTGTVHCGQARVDDELWLFPHDVKVRVRDIRVQNRSADLARPGDRAALNVTGAPTEAIRRGDWLSRTPSAGFRQVALALDVLPDFPRPVRHWTPVHVYHATRHSTARLALLEGSRAEPGSRTLAELVLDEPLLLRHGDRVVVRDQSLDRTLGGGEILDNRPPARRRRDPRRLRELAALAAADPAAALAGLLAAGPVYATEFQAIWDLDADGLAALEPAQAVVRDGDTLVAAELWRAWREALLNECIAQHGSDPTLQGLQENEFAAAVPSAYRATLLDALATEGALQRRSGRYLPPRHTVVLSSAEQQLMQRLEPLLDQAQPPSIGDIGKTLRIPLIQLQRGIKGLAGKRVLVLVSDNRVYLPHRVLPFADAAEALSARGPFSAREFRDATDVGRNVAIQILEYFDARGYTRRSGDTRVVVGDRDRLLPPQQG
ncbi:MAG: selenocysteine-specific translation elongation factor [Pseudomonadales bacterium]